MLAVDTTIVVQIAFNEPHTAEAQRLFDDASRVRERLVAPPIIAAELVNAVRKTMRRLRLPLSDAQSRLATFLALPIERIEPPGLYQRALELTQMYSLGGHDACYVALAETLGCDLWVDDGRLLRAVRGRLPFVRPIADYAGLGG